MTKYIENVNMYLSQMKIKQTYISMRTGIDSKKLSRILTGVQDINSADMEKIAKALGQKMEFFLGDDVCVPQIGAFMPEKMAFYAGSPTAEQERIAEKLVRFMENIDEVLGARARFLNLSRE
ncbi:MAG: helix-turn-helix transcriptional regulator [Lachnospiraceae bacterium]|jgi:transcriptional regulator with XRE-family HTH domain|nr:helix-turn-helix transcriptional regulator [Lachnospiraceae bacterium]